MIAKGSTVVLLAFHLLGVVSMGSSVSSNARILVVETIHEGVCGVQPTIALKIIVVLSTEWYLVYIVFHHPIYYLNIPSTLKISRIRGHILGSPPHTY